MTPEQIVRIQRLAFKASIDPIKRSRCSRSSLILGFDTEYDSKTRELLSCQFSHENHSRMFVIPPNFLLTWDRLEWMTLEFLGGSGISFGWRSARAIKLISYFSLAETQHISDLKRAKIFETSVGVDFRYKGSGGRTLEIIDLLKFFNNPPQPLAKVGESFGIPKLEYDTTKVSRQSLKDPTFEAYAIHDAVVCETVYNQLRAWYEGRWGVDIVMTKTPAQTASTIFRAHYLREEVGIPLGRTRRLAMRSAWGGRNEAFVRGVIEAPIYEYDAVSEYPNSAIEIGSLPRKLDWRHSSKLAHSLRWNGIASVRFRFPLGCRYPCLPVYDSGRLYYPRAGVTFATNIEVQLAHELGAEIKLLEGYHYSNGTECLADFMRDLLEERDRAKEGQNAVQSHALKLVVNSLIGKFLQRVDKLDLNSMIELSERAGIPISAIQHLPPVDRARLATLYGIQPTELQRLSLGSAFCPEWNCLILGYARAATSRFLVQLAEQGHSPLIMSTDSVIFAQGDSPPDPDYSVSGIRFDLRATADRAEVIRTRLYRLSKGSETVKVAHHALASRKEAERMFDAFSDAWSTGYDPKPFEYKLSRLIKLREAWTRDRVYGSEEIAARKVSMVFDGKRVLHANGHSSMPLAHAGIVM